jgi:Fe-S oxidoreductase
MRRGATVPQVALFADCFVQYQEPEIGEAFVHLMVASGTPVTVIDAGCCGRTMMSTGLLERARATASRTLERLCYEVRCGRLLAFVEPSCLSMVHDDWRRLLPGDPRVAEVAAASRFALSFVADEAAAGRLSFRPGGCALVHPHCHERSVFTSAETERALRAIPGLSVEVLDAGCCGMSGIFGYEAEHYDLSVAMAERDLLPAIRAAGSSTAVLATGTSCRTQIGDLVSRRAEHPLTLLADRLLTA